MGVIPDNGFFENAEVYIEIQSISSLPLLITAGKIKISGTHIIKPSGYSIGKKILSEDITSNTNNELLLFAPGETKILHIAQSFKFIGIMNFFNENINQTTEILEGNPSSIFDLSLVKKLNIFMAKQYGKNAAFKITIYEKNYKPIIEASINLAKGGTLFDKSDTTNNRYLIQYDSYIGEAINSMRNGEKNGFEHHFLFDEK